MIGQIERAIREEVLIVFEKFLLNPP